MGVWSSLILRETSASWRLTELEVFVGEISLLTGRRATSLCRVKSVAEVIRIPVDALRRLLVSSASFAENWMTSLLRRREVILARGVDSLHVFGDHADAATLRLREFMHGEALGRTCG